ncbi:MAG: retron system putative HNH endonuclease [Comamonas testosteroni]|uniref:retron system putative HNH endonuclease n=1 Tax=Comamonas testosteroni TaxID=285 RepID=UPI003D12DDE9
MHLQNAHANPPKTREEATSRWSSFRRHKAATRENLLNEQFFLCCYSELRADEVGLGFHIEHVENKGQNPSRTFDYSNLAASALESDDIANLKTNGEEVFGGHAVGKIGRQAPVDMQRFISPHQPDCHRFFAYVSDGRVVPYIKLDADDKDRADYTIKILNLNSPFLITLRRKWWNELENFLDEHSNNGWSISYLASIDVVPTGGKLSRFFSLTRHFYGKAAEQAITQNAPELL